MLRRYDEYTAGYNAYIDEQRKEIYRKYVEAQAATDDHLEPDYGEFQTLKPTHRAIFKDLIMELGKRMLQNINNYEKVQAEQGKAGIIIPALRNPLCGDGFFVCSTNRYQLSKHSTKEESTIYRNIRRLMDAGIIVEKIGHGQKSNFELHINAAFLVVSDKSDPTYNPLQNRTEITAQQDFYIMGKFAKCKEDNIIQEQLINKIYSASLDAVNFSGSNQNDCATVENGKIGDNKPASPSDNTIGNGSSASTTGTSTGTEVIATAGQGDQERKRNFKPTGGLTDLQNLKNERNIDNVKVFVKRDPEQWHAFHRLSHAAYFVDYLIERIYNRRGVVIIPEARIKAIEYAEQYYFPNPLPSHDHVNTGFRPCETLDQYSSRLAQLKWCIDAANRFAAKKNAYFVLINKYIDLENANGLKTTFQWLDKSKKNEQDKSKHLKNIADLRKLHEQIRFAVESATPEARQTAETYIENHLPKYIWVFRRALVTILGKK
jgi:hypothetical protein